MSERLENFKGFGRQVLGGIYEPGEHERIYTYLLAKDGMFNRIPKDKFGLEYLAARLALSCRLWLEACAENKVTDPEIEKLFLKLVMDSFQSPKFTEIATTFSDYLYAPGMEDPHTQVSILAATHFFRRLTPSAPDIPPTKGMGAFIEVLEAYKDRFQNDFFDFVNTR